jgi:hypothetical protein
MQKVIDYELVTANHPNSLETSVKEHMAEGWVPSGIIVETSHGLVQAMVKFEEEVPSGSANEIAS